MATSMNDSLQEALGHWREVNFGALQKELDAQGMSILQNQKESINSRKILAEQTREFKRLGDEEKAEFFKTVLKSYQTEIDNLTKRSKFAETAFLATYKLLADAPDPVPMLANALEGVKNLPQIEALTNENKRLRDELDNATKDFVDMKNQSSTVARLKEKLAEYDGKMEKLVKQRTGEREAQLREEYDSKIRVYKEKEFELERQVSRYKDQLVAMQSNQDSTQATIFSHSIRFDETVSAKLAELEIINMELERAHDRVSTVEQERDALRQELAKASSSPSSTSSAAQSNLLTQQQQQYEELVSTKDAEIRRLQDAIGKLNKATLSKQVTHSSVVMDLQTKIGEMTEEIDALKERLAEVKDYDDVKRDLGILKSIEFASESTVSTPGESTVNNHDGQDEYQQPAKAPSLEALLVQKNKRLQDELTAVKVSLSAFEAQLHDAIQREQTLRATTTDQQALITKLEDDLAAVHIFNDVPVSATASIPGNSAVAAAASPKPSLDGTGRPAETSIVQIITSQRDRYRKRNHELEEILAKVQRGVDELQGRLKTLTDDNVKLYEKIRYLEGYQGQRAASATPSFAIDVGASAAGSVGQQQGGGDVASKYRSLYEDRINPFTEFNEREKRKGYYNLNVAERATLSLSKFFLANKHMRMFIFFYAVVVHLFILSIIYGMGLYEECVHDHAIAAPAQFGDAVSAIGN